MKNNFSDYLIAAEGSAVLDGMLRLEVWLPWYRTLPLSVVEVAGLSVDGVPISLDGAELELNGKRFGLAALAELTEERWFVQDSAWLHVPLATAKAGAPCRAELLVKLYPPYIPMLTWVTRGSANV
ncbi:C-glycoside deglycosidase beta subunit domain-containing protein [Massilia sp. LjRoot122]|uniref:C-glycoside deglycosidase beta subunit domain-containing protein n=1 Tax=Massilia sp. LjRoot122 TaxID=3342257 RepID=UPI003ECC795F